MQDQKDGHLKEVGLLGVDGIVKMKNKFTSKTAKLAPPYDKLTKADFAVLRAKKKKKKTKKK